MTTTTTSSSSSNDRLVSDLPLHIFDKLVSRPHSAIFSNPIDLRQQILSKLQANASDDGSNITTVRELLKLSPPTMLRTLDPCLTYVECNRLLSRIYRECAAKPLSALEMMRRAQSSSIEKIPTGLSTLDQQLHGGLPVGSVVEIVGRAGVGKTHLSQQLCVLASQLGGGAVFIDAEKKLNLMRLREIAFERFLQQQQHHLQQHHANELADQVLENVTIHSLVSTQDLLDKLDVGNEITCRNTDAAQYEQSGNAPNASTRRRLPVRLIVIDSIAAPIRRDYDMMGGSSSNTAALRASALFQIAKRLKQLAYDYQVAVVVINQVGSGGMFSNRNDLQRNNALDIRDGEFTASLGTAWQYCVSTRIVLEHEDDPHRLQQEQPHGEGGNCIRVATLAKSLVSKRFKVPFELTKRGLCEVTQFAD